MSYSPDGSTPEPKSGDAMPAHEGVEWEDSKEQPDSSTHMPYEGPDPSDTTTAVSDYMTLAEQRLSSAETILIAGIKDFNPTDHTQAPPSIPPPPMAGSPAAGSPPIESLGAWAPPTLAQFPQPGAPPPFPGTSATAPPLATAPPQPAAPMQSGAGRAQAWGNPYTPAIATNMTVPISQLPPPGGTPSPLPPGRPESIGISGSGPSSPGNAEGANTDAATPSPDSEPGRDGNPGNQPGNLSGGTDAVTVQNPFTRPSFDRQAPDDQVAASQTPYGQAPNGNPQTSSAPSTQTTNSQTPYGQAPYGQAPYGQAPANRDPATHPAVEPPPNGSGPNGGFGQPGGSASPFSRPGQFPAHPTAAEPYPPDSNQMQSQRTESTGSPYDRPAVAKSPHGQAPTSQAPYGQAPYGQAPMAQAPTSQTPYGQAPTASQVPQGQPMYGEPGADRPPVGNRTKLIVIISAIAIFLVGACIAGFFILSGRSGEALTGDVTKSQEVFAADLAEGACIESLPDEGKVSQTTAVPCRTEHNAEVIGTVAINGDTFPGTESVAKELHAKCSEMAQEATADTSVVGELYFTFFAPSEENFADGKTSGACLVYTESAMTGSFKAGDVELNR